MSNIRVYGPFAWIWCVNPSKTKTAGYNSLLANYPAGAISSTSSKLHYLSPEDAACPLCGRHGGPVHLIVACPATLEARNSFNASRILHLPNAQKVSGLFSLPQEYLVHLRLLRETLVKETERCLEDAVHLFTDGSTSFGDSSRTAVASWSVMLADPASTEPLLISSGPLPGVIQSNNRAELFAILQAVKSAKSGKIYSDSLVSVQGFRRLQRSGWQESFWSKAASYDLWFQLYISLKDSGFAWDIVWVRSHCDKRQAKSPQEYWQVTHNEHADAEAKKANLSRSLAFWQNHKVFMAKLKELELQQQCLLSLQRASTVASKQAVNPTKLPRSIPAPDCFQLTLERLGMLAHDRCVGFPCSETTFLADDFLFHAGFGSLLWDFFCGQEWLSDPTGFSLAECYVMFVQSTG